MAMKSSPAGTSKRPPRSSTLLSGTSLSSSTSSRRLLSKTSQSDWGILNDTYYNAGGGAGRRNLTLDALAKGQQDMFARTIHSESNFQITRREQEERQLSVDDRPIKLIVNVSREDFPEVSEDIEICYFKSAAQQAWEVFLKQVCVKLKIEFIHSILDRSDKSPVFRILRLRPGGEYLVRQRESSAILEVINTGKNPVDVSWSITEDINHIKRELAFDLKTLPSIEKRVEKLVSRSMTKDREIEVSNQILAATTPDMVIKVIEQFHLQYVQGEDGATGTSVIPVVNPDDPYLGFQEKQEAHFGDIEKFDKNIDIVSMHRLVLESLSRFVVQGKGDYIAKHHLKHIKKVIEGLRKEVDVVVLGLKLLSDLMKHLTSNRDQVFHLVLDCVQAYSPPAPPHRPRNPDRLKSAADFNEVDFMLGGLTVPTGLNFDITDISSVGNIEMRRYGDFYGHCPVNSDPTQHKDKLGMAEINTQKEIENAGIVSDEGENGGESSDLDSPVKNNDNSVHNNSSKGVVDSIGSKPVANAKPTEIKAIITGRTRINHSAVAKALNSAYSAPAASESSAGVSTDKEYEDDKETEGDSVVEAAPDKMTPEEVFTVVSVSNKQPTYRFKIKEKPASDSTKKAWKGSTGQLGRRAVKAEVEVKIDFKKTVVSDPFADDPQLEDTENSPSAADQSASPINAVRPDSAPNKEIAGTNPSQLVMQLTAESIEVVPTENDQQTAAVAALQAAASNFTASRSSGFKPKRKNRKMKFVVKPLPLVPCIVFKGFSGKMKQNIALMQSFTTLFRMVSENYGNREAAFRMGVIDEICDVALVLQGMPRVLEYVVWIVNAMYEEGFGEAEEADDNVLVNNAQDDYSMQITISVSSSRRGRNDRNDDIQSLDSRANMIIETISEMSAPSVDEDGEYSEATPSVNMGDFAADYGDAEELAAIAAAAHTKAEMKKEWDAKQVNNDPFAPPPAPEPIPEGRGKVGGIAANAKLGEAAAVLEEDAQSPDVTEIAVGNNNKVKAPKNRKPSVMAMRSVPNQAVVKIIGLTAYEARYVNRPRDSVVLAMSLIANHHEIDARERQMATRWLDTWDDCSREYKLLKRKGMDMCGI